MPSGRIADVQRVSPIYRHQVRYHETDRQGFVFNSRYLEIVDVAMTEYLRALGLPYDDFIAAGCDPSVVTAQLDFKRPARFDDVLDVEVRCIEVGRSSFRLRTTISRGDDLVAEAELVYVNVDVASETSRPLPASVATTLQADIADSSAADVEDAALRPTS